MPFAKVNQSFPSKDFVTGDPGAPKITDLASAPSELSNSVSRTVQLGSAIHALISDGDMRTNPHSKYSQTQCSASSSDQ